MSCRAAISISGHALALCCVLLGSLSAFAAADGEVDFARDVRPILADNCFHCHGPDESTREADLRLDVFASGDEFRGAGDVILAEEPAESELLARVAGDDEYLRMPPPESGMSLTPEQVETLRRWIASGGEYQTHWAFMPPRRPEVPKVDDAAWIRNPIDAFVLARLENAGLRPSPPAPPRTLLRRLSLDLIGLPPTPEEIEAFEAARRGLVAERGRESFATGGVDRSPRLPVAKDSRPLFHSRSQSAEGAHQQAVERLLASPHYGERWGRLWLDAARYADSDGYEKDQPRQVWMYRDWVIKALNRDLPYDRFIIEQIAGDLLPEPTQDQLVATGFLRNSMINEEGGIDPEQFRMEAMFDRMDAIGKAVLGLTVQCAQCHTHKYDPLTHAEYYRLFAFLNNSHEGQITVYTREQKAEWQKTDRVIRQIEERLRAENPDWPERMAAWEEAVRDDQPEWTIVRPQLDTSGGQKHYLQEDGSILAAGFAPTNHVTQFTVDVEDTTITAVRLELLNDPNLPHGGPGRSLYGLAALTGFQATATTPDGEQVNLKFKQATADVNPPERELEPIFDNRSGKRRVTGPIEYAIDGDDTTAWGLDVGPGRSNVPRKAVFVLEEPLDASGGMRITFKLAQRHGGWNANDNQNNNLGRFRFAVTSAPEAKADPVPSAVRDGLRVLPAERTADEVGVVFSYWRTTVPEWQEENRRIEALWQSHPRGTSQLVLIERDDPRKTHRLERGDFLAPAEEVTPGVPGFLHPLDDEAPTRLSLARWLADRRSPTTARAIVNRVWQAYFGTGLVATAEDLGIQGDAPTHPELLDWLAVELMENGWSLKHIHRLIVNSSTYRQSSVVTPELLQRDPANELLARGARYRLDAELVRDAALAASGLLTRTVGGPSVFPPAPQFLFEPPASFGWKPWHYDTGRDKYRRALYTFRYRSVPHPALTNFDAPVGEVSCVRRVRSNTPLQALTTLNEPLFMEAAQALAARALNDGGSDDAERLAFVVRCCLARSPQAEELAVLQDFLDRQRQRFSSGEADPMELIAEGGGGVSFAIDDFPPPAEQPVAKEARSRAQTTPAELAAWTALARVVLNLDETITRE